MAVGGIIIVDFIDMDREKIIKPIYRDGRALQRDHYRRAYSHYHLGCGDDAQACSPDAAPSSARNFPFCSGNGGYTKEMLFA
jgi:hypothetical protein